MSQTQTASGRATAAQTGSVFQQGYRVFVADASVQKQRHDAYSEEFAEVALKGTRPAMCLPAGGELHLADGSIIPVSPWDWVVELPDGTLGSYSADDVADHFEFISGPELQEEAFEQTVKQVANARRAPRKNVPIKVEDAPVLPHPDQAQAIQNEFDSRTRETVKAEYERQASEARAQLQTLTEVARGRNLITKDEAAEWIDTGFAPEGVQVTFQQALGSWEITREKAPTEASDPGDTTAAVEGAEA